MVIGNRFVNEIFFCFFWLGFIAGGNTGDYGEGCVGFRLD